MTATKPHIFEPPYPDLGHYFFTGGFNTIDAAFHYARVIDKVRLPSVLIVRGAYGEMYEPAWLRALREIGCTAEMFDCHQFTLAGILGRLERRVLAGPGILRLRRSLLKHVTARRPDVILIYQGHYIDRDTLESLSNSSFVVGYHNDDPFGTGSRMLRYRHFHRALPAYGGFHVYRPVNVQEALAAGAPRVRLLMPAFIPWLDYPRSPAFAEQARLGSDVFFAGHCEPDSRSECLRRAVDAGLRVRVHGDPKSWSWYAPKDLLRRLGPIAHLTGDDYRLGISAARVSACFFSKKNRDQYTRRVFEITACGGFLLSERTPLMLEMFPEGIAAEYFSDPGEFVDKARFYCANEAARSRIAERGHAQVRANGHDLLSRMRQWIDDVADWRADGHK